VLGHRQFRTTERYAQMKRTIRAVAVTERTSAVRLSSGGGDRGGAPSVLVIAGLSRLLQAASGEVERLHLQVVTATEPHALQARSLAGLATAAIVLVSDDGVVECP
jgi:hypothetical protein